MVFLLLLMLLLLLLMFFCCCFCCFVVVFVLDIYIVVLVTLYVDWGLLLIEVEFGWWGVVQSNNHVKPNSVELSLVQVESEL